jgi:hypothetical protein
MKKTLIILLMTLLLPLGAMAQGHWSQFTKITRGTKVAELKANGEKTYDWYFKPVANLTAIKLEYDAVKKLFNPGEFSAGGVGIGFQHYAKRNDELVNDFGVNGLVIINGSESQNQAGFGLAATINALGFVNVGGGRDFTNKKWLILLGASWSF